MSELWQFLTILGTIIGSGAICAWWLKSQLSSAEMAGLREQIKAHETWRGLAEAQTKIVTDQLTAAKGTIETLQGQIVAGASKETLAGTASITSGAVASALSANATASTTLSQGVKVFKELWVGVILHPPRRLHPKEN
jgi:hypothetical protein